MTRIGTGAGNAARAVGGAAAGGGASPGAVASALMSNLAGKMAKNIGSALKLGGNENAGSWQGNSNDPYEIAELIAEMTQDAKGSASDVGELSRALHHFVQESASMFAARPESQSLTRLQQAIAHSADDGGTLTFANLAKKVDSATQSLSD